VLDNVAVRYCSQCHKMTFDSRMNACRPVCARPYGFRLPVLNTRAFAEASSAPRLVVLRVGAQVEFESNP